MSESDDPQVLDRVLMTQVARLHYLEDVPRVEIAARLGISRFKVARLLARSREEGVVTITINERGLPDTFLAERVRQALGITECVVVRSHGDEENVRQQVGAAAAELLSSSLHDDEVLGLTWGRTITAATSQLTSLPRVSVVQLTGYVSGELGASPIEIVRRITQSAGVAVYPIFSPLFVSDLEAAQSLKRHPDIDSALRLFPSVTTAVLSVGSWDPPNTQVRDVLAPDEVVRLEGLGCVADIAGILVRADGGLVDPDFQRRCISIGYEELNAVPRVIGVAGGAEKGDAVRAVAKAGLITSLVADDKLAEAILAGADG